MISKRQHDTRELYINEVNWPEIKRIARIAFRTSFVFLLILFAIAILLPKHQDQVEGIYVYIAVFLGAPMLAINYRVYNKKVVLRRLQGLLAVSLGIGFLMALATGEALFVFVVLSAFIPLMHLVKNTKDKTSKYIWEGISGILGFSLLILLFILSEQLTSLLVILLWGLSWLGTLIFAGFIISSLVLAITFYWLVISFAEEIYRIKYENSE